jgi:hypothetical protein
MDTDETIAVVMDFGSPNGSAFISSQIVVSEGRICVHLWFKLHRSGGGELPNEFRPGLKFSSQI